LPIISFQELRVLKNFSSLKAIISGLQSNSVYRLRRTWQAVPKDKLEIFEELVRKRVPQSRVARWYIFVPEMPILVYFGRPFNVNFGVFRGHLESSLAK
jgi:hypothetical protein